MSRNGEANDIAFSRLAREIYYWNALDPTADKEWLDDMKYLAERYLCIHKNKIKNPLTPKEKKIIKNKDFEKEIQELSRKELIAKYNTNGTRLNVMIEVFYWEKVKNGTKRI